MANGLLLQYVNKCENDYKQFMGVSSLPSFDLISKHISLSDANASGWGAWVIVSEETGSISVAIGGMLKRHLKPETLANILRNELLPQEAGEDKPKFSLMNLLRAGSTGGDNHEK